MDGFYTYDRYGNMLSKKDTAHSKTTTFSVNTATNRLTTAPAYPQPFSSGGSDQFAGQKDDPETGLKDFGARYYNSGQVRWTSPDLILGRTYDPLSLNKYAYVRNDPVNLTDRDGKDWLCATDLFGADVEGWFVATSATTLCMGTGGPVVPVRSEIQRERRCPGGEALNQINSVGAANAVIGLALADLATARTLALINSRIYTWDSQHNGSADAFRHCYWSCKMTQVMGGVNALFVGAIHEECTRKNPPAERDMDLFNNSLGISLADPKNDCESKCKDAVANGKAKILNP